MITFNFKLSVLVAMIGGIALFIHIATGFPASLDHLAGRYQYYTLMWPLIIIAIELLAWLLYYKDEEGHTIAFGIGFIILASIVGSFVSESVNDIKYLRIELWVLAYVGISHVIYGLTNWREVLNNLNMRE